MTRQILMGVLALLLFASCSKDATKDLADVSSLKKTVEEINALILPPDDDGEEGAKYVEKACVTTNQQAGTLCESAKGKCKKQRDCTAVTRVQTTLTDQQIDNIASDHAAAMVRDGYIDQQDMEASKQLYKTILTRVRKN